MFFMKEKNGVFRMVKVPYTGVWIRDHLSEVKEDFIQHMSTEYRKEMKQSKKVVSSYHQFCKMIYVLEKIGLIELVREEKSSKDWLRPRKYYRIVKGKENSVKWNNPQKHYVPKTV